MKLYRLESAESYYIHGSNLAKMLKKVAKFVKGNPDHTYSIITWPEFDFSAGVMDYHITVTKE